MGKPATKSISFRTRNTRIKKLDKLSKATQRSRSWHIDRAVNQYLEYELYVMEEVQAGIAELDAGLGIPHEEIVKEFRQRALDRKKQRSA